jgi:hypothetical protein
MYRGRFNALALAAVAGVAISPSPPRGPESDPVSPEGDGWVVVSAPQVDLWYHGMAVIGFDGGSASSIYSSEYVDRVRAEKERLGIYPTALDRVADDLREDLEKDEAFRSLHFLPLHFAAATPQEMLRALDAVGEGETYDSGALGLDTEVGFGFAARTLRSDSQREVLLRFVRALEEEWRVFFHSYWNRTVQTDSAASGRLQSEWDENAGNALRGFLTGREMEDGLIFVSPALGQHGRLVQSNAFEGLNNAVAVWSPEERESEAIISAAVREICFTAVDRRVLIAGIRGGMNLQMLRNRASVRCGAMLFEANNPTFLSEYERTFVRAAGDDADDADLAGAFEQAYDVSDGVIAELQRLITPGARVAAEVEPSEPRWIVKTLPQLDLWYHALATIGVGDEQPLPKYNPDYAAEMSRIKRDLGVFPTALDSMSEYFRSRLESKYESDFFDNAPLYFPAASPEEMLSALEAVADRRAYRTDQLAPSARIGAAVAIQVFQSAAARRVLKRFVTTLRQEWDQFYRDYWYANIDVDSAGRAALDEFWAVTVAPRIEGFLQRMRLDGGDIIVSPSVGPEGRLWEGDPLGREDNQVVVWLPSDAGPRDAAYNVVKEVCSALVDRMVGDLVEDQDELPQVRINACVRCGALLLDFYAPIMSAGYRHAMMRSVTADSGTSTVARFEARFPLEPAVLEAIRNEVRRRN